MKGSTRTWLVAAALAPGVVMALLDATVMSIAIPSATRWSRSAPPRARASPTIPSSRPPTKDAILASLDAAANIDVSHGIEAVRLLGDPTAGVATPPAAAWARA